MARQRGITPNEPGPNPRSHEITKLYSSNGAALRLLHAIQCISDSESAMFQVTWRYSRQETNSYSLCVQVGRKPIARYWRPRVVHQQSRDTKTETASSICPKCIDKVGLLASRTRQPGGGCQRPTSRVLQRGGPCVPEVNLAFPSCPPSLHSVPSGRAYHKIKWRVSYVQKLLLKTEIPRLPSRFYNCREFGVTITVPSALPYSNSMSLVLLHVGTKRRACE